MDIKAIEHAKAQLEASAETLRGCMGDAPTAQVKNALAALADADDAAAQALGLILVASGIRGDPTDILLG